MAKSLQAGESNEMSPSALTGALAAIRALQNSQSPDGALQQSFAIVCEALQLSALRLYTLGEGPFLSLWYSFQKEEAKASSGKIALDELPAGFLDSLPDEGWTAESPGKRPYGFSSGFPGSTLELYPLLTHGQLRAVLALYFPGVSEGSRDLRLPFIQAYSQSLCNFLFAQPAIANTGISPTPETTHQESEAILKAILNALPDLKFRISKEGIFLDYFASQEENINLYADPEEFLNKNLQSVLPPYLSQAIMKNLKMALKTRKVQPFEYPLHVDGEIHYFESRISAINDEEAIAVIRDITELKRTQQELQKKLRELDKKNQKLKKYVDSNLQLENFAHTVSHDLREPVRTINSFSQLLQQKYREKLDEDARAYLHFIASSAANMNTLIEDLLEYSRFNTNAQELQLIDLNHLLSAVTTSLSGLIAEKKAEIEAEHRLPIIRANWTKASQLFQNLLSNAIKFSKEGEPPSVKIGAEDKEHFWQFYIRDEGIGIKEEYHSQIFLLFRRLHSKKYYAGSGIGLSLCKRVVEQHGGKIWVESRPGEGATFYFTLPK